MNDDSIVVSIVCNTYNHERYIRDALEGFVNQITNFKYEILVMDDASTDKTASIIREYERKYPSLFNVIYHTENQCSRGLNPGSQNRKRANGKYIALCEGDDYWIDKHKLQRQVDYMESHPTCTFCFTNGKCEINDKIIKKVVPWTKESKLTENNIYDIYSIEKIGYIPTASFIFKRSDIERLPKIRESAFHGDGYMKVGYTSLGYAYFLNEDTCVYRFQVQGSATTSWKKNDEAYLKAADKFIKMYEDFHVLFGKEDDVFKNRSIEWKVGKIIRTNQYKKLHENDYRQYFKSKGIKAYCKYLIMSYFPILYRILRRNK